MNLDDLIEAWRSQDASPLHVVDETLLRLALRQEQTKLHALRRRMRWVAYLTSAFVIGLMTLFLLMMISGSDSGIDWAAAIPVAGAAGALLFGGAIHVRYRAQTQLEQSFGQSLRDQIRLRIALLDYQAKSDVRLVSLVAMGTLVYATAIRLGSRVVNELPLGIDGAWLGRRVFWWAIASAAFIWLAHASVQRQVLPRKRRLEALLSEIDAQ